MNRHGTSFDIYKEEIMKTRNETYSSQTTRERNSVSAKINWRKSSKTTTARNHAGQSGLIGAWKTRKTSVQHHTNPTVLSRSDVIILTTDLDKQSSRSASDKSESRSNWVGRIIELREREMKDVLGNISRYAIYVTMALSVVLGQGVPKLDIHIEDQKISLTEAEMKDASKIVYIPGDTLRYVITASNIGNGLMKTPEIIDPVPAGVTYVANSAKGAETEITFSINQGNAYMSWPPYYTVRNSKGILVKREATPDMISHIKWQISRNLNPGDASTMEFLVVVDK